MCEKHFKLFENVSIVNELNLFPINELIEIDLDIPELKNIYLSKEKFPLPNTNINLTVKEILESAVKILLQTDKNNILKKGFVNSCEHKLQPSHTELNTTNLLFRKRHWTALFKYLGTELSIFILTNYYIVEKINNHFVLLAGDPWLLFKRKVYPQFGISPSFIYKTKHKVKKLDLKEMIQFMQNDISNYFSIFLEERENNSIKLNHSFIKQAEKIIKRYNRIDINAVFSSKFQIDLHKPTFLPEEMKIKKERIVNLLFLIAKKILKSAFSSHSLEILKSKMTLFFNLRNNDYLEKNDLLSYFRFNDQILKGLEFTEKRILFEKILLFLFKNVFFPIVFHCFCASKTSYSKHEVFYFTRKEWEFYSEISINKFLNNFDYLYPEKTKNNFISNLKIIPKHEGFRVITNMKSSRKYKYLEVYLFEKLKNKLNNSTLSHYNFSNKLKEYLSENKNNFFIKFDLKQCYDNLPHDKLNQFLNDIFKEDDKFIVQGYNILESKRGSLNYLPNKKCFKKRVTLNEILKSKKQKNNQLIFEDFFFMKMIKKN